jgi:hypothetical protein
VYDIVRVKTSPRQGILCELGRPDRITGIREGEFDRPCGVAVTADSTHVVVCDFNNQRLQLLRLRVVTGSSAASGVRADLEFERAVEAAPCAAKGGLGLVSAQAQHQCGTSTTSKRKNRRG